MGIREWLSAMDKLCSTKFSQDQAAALEDFLTAGRQVDQSSCEVLSFPFTLHFKRQATGVWMAKEKPPLSQCGILNVVTLRSHEGVEYFGHTKPDGSSRILMVRVL